MANSGYVLYSNLEEYYLDNSDATGNTKPNTSPDPDYIPTFYDPILCPLPSVTPTVTPTKTPTPTPSISSPTGPFRVDIAAKLLDISEYSEVIDVFYKIDNGSWVYLGSTGNSDCTDIGSVIVNNNSILSVAAMTGSIALPVGQNPTTDDDVDIQYYTVPRGGCTDYNTNYTYRGITDPYRIVITRNTTISLGAIVIDNHLVNNSTRRIVPTPTPSISPGPYTEGYDVIGKTYNDVWLDLENETIGIVGNKSIFTDCDVFFSTYFTNIEAGDWYLGRDGFIVEITTDGSDYAYVKVTAAPLPSIPVTPSISVSPTPSVSLGTVPNILNYGAGLSSCVVTNDYVNYFVTLDNPSWQDIGIQLSIDMFDTSNVYQYTTIIPVLIPAGSTTNTVGINPCVSGGFISNGFYPVACISSILYGDVNNPFGLCGQAPVVTPSISVSPTRTPSVTPTKSVSISVTPTPTKTPTPTPSRPINITIANIGSGAATINNVYDSTDNSQFYTIISGNFPLINGQSITAKGSTNNPIGVQIIDYAGNTSLTLYKNGILQQCMPVDEDGYYVFTKFTINPTDTLVIKLEKAC